MCNRAHCSDLRPCTIDRRLVAATATANTYAATEDAAVVTEKMPRAATLAPITKLPTLRRCSSNCAFRCYCSCQYMRSVSGSRRSSVASVTIHEPNAVPAFVPEFAISRRVSVCRSLGERRFVSTWTSHDLTLRRESYVEPGHDGAIVMSLLYC